MTQLPIINPSLKALDFFFPFFFPSFSSQFKVFFFLSIQRKNKNKQKGHQFTDLVAHSWDIVLVMKKIGNLRKKEVRKEEQKRKERENQRHSHNQVDHGANNGGIEDPRGQNHEADVGEAVDREHPIHVAHDEDHQRVEPEGEHGNVRDEDHPPGLGKVPRGGGIGPH